MLLGCFYSDIYGIRINNKYIIFKDGYLRRKYLLEDIKNIEVWFIKMKKHYKVSMKVNFNYTYNKMRFEWDEIYVGKRGFVKTRINDSNINEYIELFKSLDKFYVYPVK